MRSDRQLEELRQQVKRDRAALGDRVAPWALPVTALAAGWFLPVLSNNDSANPITQFGALARQAIGRFFSFLFYRNVFALLHRAGVIDALTVEDTE